MCELAASIDLGATASVVAVVAAVAAVVAIGLAWLTVHETRAMRREERLARLPELVVAVGESLLEFDGISMEWRWPIAAGRLRAALAFVDDPLPKCRQLVHYSPEAHVSGDPIRGLVTAALDGLANVRR